MELGEQDQHPEAFEVLYTDFTEIRYDGGKKKAYLILLLDHKTKLVVGWGVAERKNTVLALEALSMAHENLAGHGVHGIQMVAGGVDQGEGEDLLLGEREREGTRTWSRSTGTSRERAAVCSSIRGTCGS